MTKRPRGRHLSREAPKGGGVPFGVGRAAGVDRSHVPVVRVPAARPLRPTLVFVPVETQVVQALSFVVSMQYS